MHNLTPEPSSSPDNNEEFSWLREYTRRIPVHGCNIRIISKPKHFYQELLNGIRSSQKRIVLSALYLGVSEKEEALVSEIKNSMKDKANLQVDVLLDFCRGSRGAINSRTMLQPLLESSENVHISLYHTPLLRGLWKQALPERANEIVGLQHIKVYIFDDRVIMSGANLSSDYFTQRQDRYIVFDDSPQLANYFHHLVTAISTFSYQLQPGGDVKFSPQCPENPITGDFDKFASFARSQIQELADTPINEDDIQTDTYVYPSVQIGCLGLLQDQLMTSRLLKSFQPGSKVTFTTGYFNITDEYATTLADGNFHVDIVTASPEANGFLGSNGISGYIPHIYINLTKIFYRLLERKSRLKDVRILEYLRPEWTYHAKGIWYQPPSQLQPSLTVIGSSNFGARSVSRDVEAQLTIVTSHKELRGKLKEERESIVKWSKPVTEETFAQSRYKIPRFVNILTNLVKKFF